MIAVVSNWQAERCGIQAFGVDFSHALEHAGFGVIHQTWEGHTQRYGPLFPWGVGHTIYNWHPQTAPAFVPATGPYTVIAHEIPPHVVWPAWVVQAQLVLTGEPHPDYTHLVYPSLDYWSPCQPPEKHFRVGTTGIRGDGLELLREVCQLAKWDFSCSPTDRFASRQEEIDRLASCHVNVLWYWASGRARSLSLPVILAARRPTLCSQSTMLAGAQGLTAPWTDNLDRLAELIIAAHATQPTAPTITWSETIGAVRRLWRDRGIEL